MPRVDAGLLLVVITMAGLGVGLGIGAFVGARVPLTIAGLFVGFLAGIYTVYWRYRDS